MLAFIFFPIFSPVLAIFSECFGCKGLSGRIIQRQDPDQAIRQPLRPNPLPFPPPLAQFLARFSSLLAGFLGAEATAKAKSRLNKQLGLTTVCCPDIISSQQF